MVPYNVGAISLSGTDTGRDVVALLTDQVQHAVILEDTRLTPGTQLSMFRGVLFMSTGFFIKGFKFRAKILCEGQV